MTTQPKDDLVERLLEAMIGATARPWVAFDSGERKAVLAVMKGRRPKRQDRYVLWPEIIAWSGFDGADVSHPQRRANLHMIVKVINALPEIIAALTRIEALEAALAEREGEIVRLMRSKTRRTPYPDRKE